MAREVPATRLLEEVIRAADKVWESFLAYGPVDDGRKNGEEFDAALVELKKQVNKARKRLVASRPS